MHLHAEALAEFLGGPPVCAGDQKILFPGIDPSQPVTLGKLATCASPLPAPATDAEVKRDSSSKRCSTTIPGCASTSCTTPPRWSTR